MTYTNIDHMDAIEMLQGRAECSVDWDTDEDNVTVIGVAEGDVRILHWEDL